MHFDCFLKVIGVASFNSCKYQSTNLHVAPQFRQEGDGRASLQIRVQILLELRRRDQRGIVNNCTRRQSDLSQQVHLQVRSERVRQPHIPRERRQNEVSHLNAVRRDLIAEAVVVVTEELGEVMEEY